jgi:hypothetical protein
VRARTVLEKLASDGHVYTTIDEKHYSPTLRQAEADLE